MPENIVQTHIEDSGRAPDDTNIALYAAGQGGSLSRPSHFGHPLASAYNGLYSPYMQIHGNPSLLYDSTLTSSYYGEDRYSSSMDFSSGFRRKNATKETTSALKAWLIEHKKNPYPTKGEKIMLAILTRMTLTQISTWFANARRRLKKENKMTWSPRTCCGKNEEDCRSRKAVADSSGQNANSRTAGGLSSCESDDTDNDDEEPIKTGTTKACGKRSAEDEHDSHDKSLSVDKKKPKIWSIAETVASSPTIYKKPTVVSHTMPFHLVFPPWPQMAPMTSVQQPNFMFRPELLIQNLTANAGTKLNHQDHENGSKVSSTSSQVSSTTATTNITDLEQPCSSSSTSQ